VKIQNPVYCKKGAIPAKNGRIPAFYDQTADIPSRLAMTAPQRHKTSAFESNPISIIIFVG